ncbi:DNA polymerase [Chengkuizengella sp. SCS-71B]|uniref:DNA polymerase n=1 Tax=Chengkuizengella sp. SCS-71B TaxID=3115290 RepID=UPI0032C2484E
MKRYKILSIDIETYCETDLKTAGMYRYVDCDSFEVTLFAYAWDDGPVIVIDLLDFEDIPSEVMEAMTDSNVIKTAWNATFERTCITKHFGVPMPADQWRCSMVHAYYLGLPGSLDKVGNILRVDAQKDSAGKALIKYFAVPCKATKKNGGRTRNLPHHDPEKWSNFIEYCRRDVESEREIREMLEKHPVPDFEQKLWVLDQQINDRGVQLQHVLAEHAITCDTSYQEKQMAEASKLTGLDNPNSVTQLKKWISEKEGIEVKSLNKETVPVLLKEVESEEVRRVLELRKEMAKTSVKKYITMKKALCSDGRVRGLLQFYGANRTGRWAGRLVQVHNLPKNKIPDIDLARQLLIDGDFELIEILFGNVPSILSQLIRTTFIPSEGNRFIVSDFSAIEARVIAWLAGEQWRLDVFNTHGKIYEASAAQMFKVPIESIDKGSDLRQRGKVAELALGYQGGPNALIQMGALDMGIPEEDLQSLVNAWRNANQAIKKFWYDVGNAAIKAVEEKRTVKLQHGLAISYATGGMFIKLPSGRRLAYVSPRIEMDKRFNRPKLTYEGVGDQGQWKRLDTYGGKLVENIVQAVARDCLAIAMTRLDAHGYKMVMHVHDEVIIDEPCELNSMEEIEEIMGKPIEWAPGLPLRGDGFETNYYMKD